MQELSGVLEKMSGVLEAQAGFREEIQSLRREVALLRNEREQQAQQHRQKIAELEKQIEFLRTEKTTYRENAGFGTRTEQAGSARQERKADGSRGAGIKPPASFLGRPLVIHRGEEYIGVVGRGKPFTLAMLISLIERNAGSQKVRSMEWRRDKEQWMLVINSQDADGSQKHEHELRVARTTTPSGNTVTQLCRLRIDGDVVPENFLLALFKSIKDGLES
ncbi:hypothetical protein [Oleidesulfovibrio sp.]|uniref:hypothetical protein n=1 Tax=Oleidesulfovibrio sp. TaxID=2909707 RepID=UPI003A8B5E62